MASSLPPIQFNRISGPRVNLLRGPATPSVTSALKAWSNPQALQTWADKQLVEAARANPDEHDPDVLRMMNRRALVIGSILHQAIEGIPHPDVADDLLIPVGGTDDIELKSLALSYRKWWDTYGKNLRPVGVEKPVAGEVSWDMPDSDPYYITGTVDLQAVPVSQSAGEFIIDWKTSKRPHIEHVYQVSAYARMSGYEAGQVVYLSKRHKRGKFEVRTLAPIEVDYGWYPVAMGVLKFNDFPMPGETLPDWDPDDY